MRRIAIAALVVLAMVGAGVSLASTTSTATVDADHALTTEAAVQEYEHTGVVNTSLGSPAVDVTIAEESSMCGVDQGVFSDTRNDYICFNHKQDRPTTLRIWIPDDYWHPFSREAKQSLSGNAEASFSPVENSSYTSVRVHFDQKEKAVFPIPEDVAASYALIDAANNRSEDYFGRPILGKSTKWYYVNPDDWNTSDNPTIAIKSPPGQTVLQYDASDNKSETQWTTLPESESHPADVYITSRDSENTVYVFAETDDPPAIRYKRESGALGQIESARRQISQIATQMEIWIENALPGWLGGNE
jgi:hypothetical protein